MVRIDAAADRCENELVRLPARRPPPHAASSSARRAPSRPFPRRTHVLRAADERSRAVRSARAPPARRRCDLWVTADENRASQCRESGFQQLQVSSPQMSPQMAAESMLIGTALTADITGVVPDHRRGDRSAERPPTARRVR